MDRLQVELIQSGIALAGTIAIAKYAWGLRRSTAKTEGETPQKAKRAQKRASETAQTAPAPTRDRRRWVIPVLVALAVISAASYLRFGYFHFPTFVHNWDMFHYYVGARYFDEMGYTELYQCTLEADQELNGRLRDVRRVRNLETLRVVAAREILREEPHCRERFTAERWEAFKRDLRYFHSITPRGIWRRMLVDKGYNGTPAWTVPVAALADWANGDPDRIVVLGAIDEVLIILALLCVWWAFGLRTFLMATFFAGINFAMRFQHLGGSVMRLDWLAMLVVSLCCIKKERWALAGAAVAVGAMARLFPILFVFGVAVRALIILVKERRLERRYLRFASSCLVVMAALGALGTTTARGPSAWSEFTSNILSHSEALATKRIGLKYVLLTPAALRLERGAGWNDAMNARWRQLKPVALGIGLLSLLVLGVGVRRIEDYEAFALGVVPLFFLMAPTRYYWGCLLVPFIAWVAFERPWQRVAIVALLAMQAFLFFWASNYQPETLPLSTVSSWLLLLIFTYVIMSLAEDDLGRFSGWLTARARALVAGKKASGPAEPAAGPGDEGPDASGSKADTPGAKGRRRLRRSSIVALALALLAILGTGCALAFCDDGSSGVGSRDSGPWHTLVATGDTALARRMHYHVLDHGVAWPTQEVARIISEADLAMTNLEGVVASVGDLWPKEGRNPYYFRGHPALLDVLTTAGFDVVVTSNNHSMDYGPTALQQQAELLDASGIAHFGSGRDLREASEPTYVTVGDVTIAFIGIYVNVGTMGASASKAGVFQRLRDREILDAVRAPYLEARRHADLVVLSPHWGDNWTEGPTSERVQVAHDLIDLGFDAIIGHSAHQLHGMELYKQRPILYDIGNFVCDFATSDRMAKGAIFELEFDRRGFSSVRLKPLRLEPGRARLASGEFAAGTRELFTELTSDLGELPLERDGEDLTITFRPAREEPLAITPPSKALQTGRTRAVPERFKTARDINELDAPPAWASGFTPIPMEKAVDIIGAQIPEAVRVGSGFVVAVALKVRETVPGPWEARIVAKNSSGRGQFTYRHPISEVGIDLGTIAPGRVVLDKVCVRSSRNLEPGRYDLFWALRDRAKNVTYNAATRPGAMGPEPAKIGSIQLVADGVSRLVAGLDWDGRLPVN